MSSEQEQAPVEETPATPENGEPQVNWQERYDNLQPEFTRKSQQLSQYEQLIAALQDDDLDTRNAAAQALGLEVEFVAPEDDEYPLMDEDPIYALQSQIQQLEGKLTEREQSEIQQAHIAQIESHIESELSQLDGLDAEDHEWIIDRALSSDPDENGMPPVRAVYDQWVARETARQKKWSESKRAPAFAQGGVQANEITDPTNHEERVAMMLAQLAANETAQ